MPHIEKQAERLHPDTSLAIMDATYVERMKQRLKTMRRVAAMSHDPRIVQLVTETADQIQEDIQKLEGEAAAPITIHVDRPPEE